MALADTDSVYLTSPPLFTTSVLSMDAKALPPETDEDFQARVQAAFACLRDRRRPKGRIFRALLCVP